MFRALARSNCVAAACVRAHIAHSTASSALWRHVSRRAHGAARAPLVACSDEVRQALDAGKPVVALESTIVSHGMPYPQNVATAVEVEDIVRSHGATPATIAVMDGRVCVGLDTSQLEALGKLGRDARKCSRRDIAVCVGSGATGATTVAGTMAIANMVPGIDVFVTGGLGGVHRGYEETLDISADLTELGRTPIAVVCAGVKSILDIGKTLEVLETNGVTVAGFGTDEFPAFWSPSSGFPVSCRVDTSEEAAALIRANLDLRLESGIVIGVPYTGAAEQSAQFEAATKTALSEVTAQGISGRDVTPYLLKRIVELTSGASLEANIALVKNNAHTGAKIATVLAGRMGAVGGVGGAPGRRSFSTGATAAPRRPVVVGGAVVDIVASPAPGGDMVAGTSNPGVVRQSFGGVGRNIAECLARLQAQPSLVTVVGRGNSALIEHCNELGIDTTHLVLSDSGRSATYVAVLGSDGDLVTAVADMECFDELSGVAASKAISADTPVVVIDGNPTVDTIRAVALAAAAAAVPVWFEPTSVAKATRAVESGAMHAVSVVSPNADEVVAMAKAVIGEGAGLMDDAASDSDDEAEAREDNHGSSVMLDKDGNMIDVPSEELSDDDDEPLMDDEDEYEMDGRVVAAGQMVLAAMCTPVRQGGEARMGALVDGRKHVVITMGKRGSLWLSAEPLPAADAVGEDEELGLEHVSVFFQEAETQNLDMQLVPPQAATMVDATGAGDTMVGASVWGLCQGMPMSSCLGLGSVAAAMAVGCHTAVPDALTPAALLNLVPDE